MTLIDKIKDVLKQDVEVSQRATGCNAWYAHYSEVRGPFMRWFICQEVPEEYKKHVAETWDECEAAAHKMNHFKSRAKALEIAVKRLEWTACADIVNCNCRDCGSLRAIADALGVKDEDQ